MWELVRGANLPSVLDATRALTVQVDGGTWDRNPVWNGIRT